MARDLLRFIFFATGWPLLVDTPEKLEKLVKTGYEFNHW
jgi:hypothetical protein